MTGIVSFMSILQDYKKHRQAFLKSLLFFIFFYNLYVSTLFSYHYALKNIFQNSAMPIFNNPILSTGLLFLLLGGMFAYAFNFFRASLFLQFDSISKKSNILFSLTGMIPLGLLLYLLIDYPKDSIFTIITICQTWMMSMIFFMVILNMVTLIKNRKSKGDPNSIKPFSWIFFWAFLISLPDIINDAYLHLDLSFYSFSIGLFAVNLGTIIWFKYFYLKNRSPFSQEKQLKLNIDHWCSQNKITEREREIIELIMQGKQNQEIADLLFISVNTVKTYVYRIFKKLNIRNRSQLAARVLPE